MNERISVVTVCYNAVGVIEKTIKSVIIQINNMINNNKKNYEFIKNNILKLYNQTNINI